MNQPHINVTPLIDVLLVLLIIFMVVAPIKPSSFKARIPQEPDRNSIADTNTDALIAVIEKDRSLSLDRETGLGSPDDTARLVERLRSVFKTRLENGSVSAAFADDAERPMQDRIERTVFIRAPRALDYGSVARVVDAVKEAGAYPISLQIDGLDGAN
jgi:biopolymer transport protein ExbD